MVGRDDADDRMVAAMNDRSLFERSTWNRHVHVPCANVVCFRATWPVDCCTRLTAVRDPSLPIDEVRFSAAVGE